MIRRLLITLPALLLGWLIVTQGSLALGSPPAEAGYVAYTYDGAAYAYDALAELSPTSARVVTAENQIGPEATTLMGNARVRASGVAANSGVDAVDVAASRVSLRVGTKAEIRANAPRTADGDFIDPNTGQVIPKDGPFDYGHQPGYEWWRTQQIAREQGWTRQQLIEYENDASHFQIEDPASNRSHAFEMPR